MAKKLTITLESRDSMHDVSHTDVKTYNDTLASIYFLEDEDGHDFHYCIQWNGCACDDCMFKTELEAVRYVCKKCGLMEKYDSLPLRYGMYWNSEEGAVRFDKAIDLCEPEFQFVPAYYEWHFIDSKTQEVLANWPDPIEDLYDDYNKETGETDDEPHLMTDYEEVMGAVETFIQTGDNSFDGTFCDSEGKPYQEYNGVKREQWDKLPESAIDIITQALFSYYIAE